MQQRYPYVEVIIVNDASTDNSSMIVDSYRNRFKNRGYRFIKIDHLVNKGQAAAINTALPLFNGEYLMWPDSDDILDPDNISDKVEFLEQNQQYDFVMAQGEIVEENDLENVKGVLKRTNNMGEDNLFIDFLNGENLYFAPVGFWVKRKALLESIPNLKIYESRSGQNWQFFNRYLTSSSAGI